MEPANLLLGEMLLIILDDSICVMSCRDILTGFVLSANAPVPFSDVVLNGKETLSEAVGGATTAALLLRYAWVCTARRSLHVQKNAIGLHSDVRAVHPLHVRC